ncbi:adenylyl-sulfate kinase [Antarcticibacterium sp. 1MA-6-2]|uniref:adenylyl-sulfate kinase n=1 Tax=Antarcticibacterium sp. 1MA-6-2 TaxID=2908210 RepID=UPI001F36A351|nr:adenylyl-sulfate kinase [Antarcticibacterium sp. 1MA-6-2]UJH91285.1 adenylyl-sulfate kinase [Antarcticibacterium sp. 1MA-6-2]
MSSNITGHSFHINRAARNDLKGHSSFVVWFTGLSGSGKSTLSNAIEVALINKRVHTYSLDGDNIRLGLNKGLGFQREDRRENLRRIAEVARLFVDSGVVVLASFVSPLQKDRDLIRNIIGDDDYVEVFVNTPIEECEKRDVKGLYKKARAGEISNFTGIDAPYESPVNPDIEIDGKTESIEESEKIILQYLSKKLDIKEHE